MEYNLDSAVPYHYGKFPPKTLDYEKLVPHLTRALEALVRYEEMLKRIPDSNILLGPLITQEAVVSSRMEGTVSTIDEVLRYEADTEVSLPGAEYASQDTKETALYKKTLQDAQHVLENGRPLTQSLLKTMHQQLLSEGRGASKSPGKFKIEQNYIADRKKVLFIPVSPEKLQEGLDDLFSYIKKSQHLALIKIAITHVEFEALHPFEDGNGRIGRMLITLLLWQLGKVSEPHFYLSDYLDEHRNDYLNKMRDVSEHDAWGDWLVFFFEAIEQQAKKNYEVAVRTDDLYQNLKIEFQRVLQSKDPSNTVKVLDFMFKSQKFRNNKFVSEMEKGGIPGSTAARYAKELLKEDLLTEEEKASGRRPALYSLKPLMALVREL
jgi:Fic family protein